MNKFKPELIEKEIALYRNAAPSIVLVSFQHDGSVENVPLLVSSAFYGYPDALEEIMRLQKEYSDAQHEINRLREELSRLG